MRDLLRRGPVAFAAILAAIGTVLVLALTLGHPPRPHLAPAAAAVPATPRTTVLRPVTVPSAPTPVPSAPAPVPASNAPPASNPAPPTATAPQHSCLGGATPACTTVSYDNGTLTVGGARFAVGRPGDVIATGRWRCGVTATLALLRPSTGEIWIFPTWPGGPQSVAALPVGAVRDARSVASVARDNCDALSVTRADGTVVELGPWPA